MDSNILSFIGLMRRAGRVDIGMESVSDSCRSHCARLIVVSEDASKNTISAVKNAITESKAQLITIPFSKVQIGEALGRAECAVFAVTNTGFARALCEKLGMDDQEESLQERQEREIRRKKKKTDRQELKKQEQLKAASAEKQPVQSLSPARKAANNRAYAQRRTGYVSKDGGKPAFGSAQGGAKSRAPGNTSPASKPSGGYQGKNPRSVGKTFGRTAFSQGNKRGK